ncbi:MAG TPA: UvrD-helicase domain-containing protein [Thermoguttaceae bacterium]
MDHLLEGLTAAQREAVTHLEGPLLILAGAGSGKTRVVTHRVAWLLASGIPGQQILALTFTNKAADEMKQRIERLVGEDSVWVGTFHRFCAKLLRKYASFIGLQENYSIYDVDDSTQVLRKAMRQTGTDISHVTPDAIARAISWAKNNLITPSQYLPRSGYIIGAQIQDIYPAYQSILLSSNAVDFDDLLLHVATLLRDHPEVRQTLDERYRFILVDEYQDTNLAQYAIVRAMSIDPPNLAVTGDPDQSIYGWRGANLNNILEFENDYPNVRVVRLERNYRSTKLILRVASQLISHNIRRKEKSLYTENGSGVPVRLVRYNTHLDEAEDIAARIAAEVRSGRRQLGDFAVFYRVNALSLAFELAFRAQGIAFQMVNSLEFFQRQEIKDILAYLQLLNNPMDEVAFLRVINKPARGIGKTTVGKLADFALQQGCSMIDAARRAREITKLGSQTAGRLNKFMQLFDSLSQLVDCPTEELLGHLLAETGIRDQYSTGDEEDQQRLANIEQLLSVARDFDERHGGGSYQLEAFLEETCLVNDTDDWHSEANRVTLMTLHSSKGLEFPVVYIVAAEEGILPHERSRDLPDELEEERRLLFVGITRARQELQISLAQYRDYRGQRKMTIPSGFLMDLPREEMELKNFGPDNSLASSSYSQDNLTDLDELHEEYEEPVVQHIETEETEENISPARLHAATKVSNSNARLPPLGPDDFVQGSLVIHPQYGLGRIVALSGSGHNRQAVVDFQAPTGRMKFLLASSPILPVTTQVSQVKDTG